MGRTTHLEEEKRELSKDMNKLARLGVRLMDFTEGGIEVTNGAESSLVLEVKEKQYQDPIFLDLKVNDLVYLKVSPMKGALRFRKKQKLSPRYIGPYRISKSVGNVAYELKLPQELEAVHPVFHVSMLMKCLSDTSLIVPTKNVGIKDKLSYEETPVQILDRQLRKLRTNEVALVKILWRNQFVEEETWEPEEDMKKRYPHLFEPWENADQCTKFSS
ncbi:hypothetical protein EJD97_002534 [Solanum chilense]|uniref:Chromo domain-containing protein n=1 Tax=Solanum chilense TaxID=4083 RepID=A0A6N2APU4_SOLCI|nr:hypothetical protein EJD97_002534 [Solanum chilense]